MTTPQAGPVPAHNLHTWSGIFGSVGAPAEEWQFTLKTPQLGSSVGSANALQPTLQPMIDAYGTHLRSMFGAHVILTKVQAAAVNDAGLWHKDAAGSFVRSELAASVAGNATSPAVYPFQIATCVTLLTARSGPTGKGRFYLPSPWATIGTSDGMMTTGNTLSIAASIKAFLDALKPTIGGVRVFSSKGYSSPVTQIRVGRVLDTQRRRRGRIPEGYATSTLA